MDPNVFVHPEYGQFSLKLQLDVKKLDQKPDLEVIKDNLKKIRKAKTFLFFPSRPGNPLQEDERRIVELVGIEYKELRGSIRPVFGKHSDFLGYECSFSATKKYAEGYDPISKGLTKLAMNELESELARDFEEWATKSREWLVDKAIKQYVTTLEQRAKNHYEQRRQDVVSAQKRLQQAVLDFERQKEVYKQVKTVIDLACESKPRMDGHPISK